jgi:hypothetical protein
MAWLRARGLGLLLAALLLLVLAHTGQLFFTLNPHLPDTGPTATKKQMPPRA